MLASKFRASSTSRSSNTRELASGRTLLDASCLDDAFDRPCARRLAMVGPQLVAQLAERRQRAQRHRERERRVHDHEDEQHALRRAQPAAHLVQQHEQRAEARGALRAEGDAVRVQELAALREALQQEKVKEPEVPSSKRCRGTCVTGFFSLLCDEIDRSAVCPGSGRCCITRSPPRPKPSKPRPSQDSDEDNEEKEFEPTVDMLMNEFDDEATIDEEEAMDQEDEGKIPFLCIT